MARRRLTEDVVGSDAALVFRDMGEQCLAGDVADGPQALAEPAVLVDPEAAPGESGNVDADGVEAHLVNAGSAAGAEQDHVDIDGAAVVELGPGTTPVRGGAADLSAEPDVDPVGFQGHPSRGPRLSALPG